MLSILFSLNLFSAEKLSSLNIVESSNPLKLKEGFISYEMNAPLWSGKVLKKRWFKLPANTKFSILNGEWIYPDGTIVVKNFYTNSRNLETRVATKTSGVWSFKSYKWDETQSDADLIENNHVEKIQVDGVEHSWTFPNEGKCLECHSSNRIFGLKTEQLNKVVNGQNQMEDFASKGIISPFDQSEYLKQFVNPYDITKDLTQRARSYLHVSCSTCHSSQGTAPGGMDFDYSLPIDLTNTYFVLESYGPVDGQGSFRILPGEKEESVLWLRLKTTGHKKMSPLRPIVDTEAVDFIGKYIDQLY